VSARSHVVSVHRSNTLGPHAFRLASALCVGCSMLAPGKSLAQDVPPDSQLLSFGPVHDSVDARRDQSTVEATVAFLVRNRSDKVIYGMSDCGRSPMYWVERREIDTAGNATWREVFSAACTWREPPRQLAPSDSSLAVSTIVQFPGQWPQFTFSSHPDLFRFVYVVSTEADRTARLRVVSPPVVIKARQ
jgi:hypothetical protein